MADTGAPWNLPYPLSTDLVRDGAQAIEDLAEEVADKLTDLDTAIEGAGGLVAVKHVLKTDTFVSGTVAAGGNVAVTGLSITHEVADPANRLIITAYFGVAAQTSLRGNTGIAVAENGTLIGVGGAEGNRTRVGAGGWVAGADDIRVVSMPSVTFVHTPGAGAKTYTVRAINIRGDGRTLYVNRTQIDDDFADRPRGASALVIQEIKV